MGFNETWSVNQEADAEQTCCSVEPEGFTENVDYIGLLMHMQSLHMQSSLCIYAHVYAVCFPLYLCFISLPTQFLQNLSII